MTIDPKTGEPIDGAIKKEIIEILRQYTLAINLREIISSILKSLVNFSHSTAGFYVYLPNGKLDRGEFDVAVMGQDVRLQSLSRIAELPEGESFFEQFKDWAESCGWRDLESEFVIQSSDKSQKQMSIYCVPLRDQGQSIIGFLGFENEDNPFAGIRLDGILVALAAANVRLNIARGRVNSLGIIMGKILHDINGGLSIIALQTEMMSAYSERALNVDEVRSRIKTGLQKVDFSTNLLASFSNVLFGEQSVGDYGSSKSALDLALISLPIDAALRSKIHISTSEIEDDIVRGNGLVLYWLYRAVLASWTNQDFWDPKDPVEMFIELRYNDENRRNIDLVLSRSSHSTINMGVMSKLGVPHGYSKSGLSMMSPDFALNFWCRLFGGEFKFKIANEVWVITISMPVA